MSEAAAGIGHTDIRGIISKCNANNQKAGLTGFLHFEGGHFLQYLEGPKEKIEETMARIANDPRHTNIEVLSSEPLETRRIPDWQMGFVDGQQLSLADMLDVPGDSFDLRQQDPFDLIVFLVSNANFLRDTEIAA